jgi:lipoprotein-anchoring transpeptidase ErfK/SrfK
MKPASLIVCALLLSGLAGPPASAAPLTGAAINAASFSKQAEEPSHALVAKAQVLLDRARFSPGAIDGREGDTFGNALKAFQRQNGLKDSGELDEATWTKLSAGASEPAIVDYTISADDVKGPFADVPSTMEEMTKLKRLAYSGPKERLAERFHMDEDLLGDLNPEKDFSKAGTTISVANVRRPQSKDTVVKIEVEKSRHLVKAFAQGDKLVAVYPASIGSEEKPAPSGTLKIIRVTHNPVYVYNPKFNFKGVAAKTKLRIAPGPNNPVGAVWMSLNENSYGIHGTAEPTKVGKVGSHGCVRLTNWDAWSLAAMVKKGTTVVFIE